MVNQWRLLEAGRRSRTQSPADAINQWPVTAKGRRIASLCACSVDWWSYLFLEMPRTWSNNTPSWENSPPWTTKILLWINPHKGMQSKTFWQAANSTRPFGPGYLVNISSSNPIIRFCCRHSWLPRLTRICLGNRHLNARTVKSTSAPFWPRSTKSPLKRYSLSCVLLLMMMRDREDGCMLEARQD